MQLVVDSQLDVGLVLRGSQYRYVDVRLLESRTFQSLANCLWKKLDSMQSHAENGFVSAILVELSVAIDLKDRDIRERWVVEQPEGCQWLVARSLRVLVEMHLLCS